MIFFYHRVQEANVPVSYVYSFINGKDNPSDVLRKYYSYIVIRRTSYGEHTVNTMAGHNYWWKIQQAHKLMPLASTRIIVLASVIPEVVLMIQLVHHIIDRSSQQLTVPVLGIIVPI